MRAVLTKHRALLFPDTQLLVTSGTIKRRHFYFLLGTTSPNRVVPGMQGSTSTDLIKERSRAPLPQRQCCFN
ncbi:hypothetical protein NDU88_002062 [Pleurodeles waltl]|uniref:Uncharacterized protein n=1 Tax=Pleurodeles waltl TaxID=8319 RepID=A0AAV7R908_PLEWA|nr:hypothetical protein NDU88_002062 [Pleurodeles waltl]